MVPISANVNTFRIEERAPMKLACLSAQNSLRVFYLRLEISTEPFFFPINQLFRRGPQQRNHFRNMCLGTILP